MLPRLKKRAEFLRANRGAKRAVDGLVLQARRREPGEWPGDGVRVGFTTSKKVGGAVTRNRARRRLRAAAEAVLGDGGAAPGRPGVDYVLIGRAETPARPWAALLADLERAVGGAHRRLDEGGGGGASGAGPRAGSGRRRPRA